MTQYRYTARDPEGRRIRGRVDANSARAAATSLRHQGLAPQRLREHRTDIELRRRRVHPTELMHLSRQLAAFLRAGIPILASLESLAEATDNPTLRGMLLDIAEALREGESFADALDDHPRLVPAVYRGMVRSAEETGNLDEVLDQLSEYLERDLDTRQEIRSALTYPVVILLFAMFTVVVLAGWVIPRFEVFFGQFGATLPLPTRMLLATTAFVGTWWWALLAGGAAVGAGLAAIGARPRGRAAFDRLLLSFPVAGEAVRHAIVERFCRTLGSMVHAGVPLPDAMAVATAGTNNAVFVRALDEARAELLEGAGIAEPIADTGLFPSSIVQMVRAGEDTGTLDEQLRNAATFFERELRFRIKHLTSLFEPFVIAVVGALVGFVALALVSAMYGIYSQVQ